MMQICIVESNRIFLKVNVSESIELLEIEGIYLKCQHFKPYAIFQVHLILPYYLPRELSFAIILLK